MMPHGKVGKSQPPMRSDYVEYVPITTRWSDNDIYGHVNNAMAYFYFDTAVNQLLIHHGALDIHDGSVIGLVVETRCSYHAPMAFPNPVTAGVRVEYIGTSSVRYGVALFEGNSETASANGQFTHVYVDRSSRRPLPLPGILRETLESLYRGEGG